MGQKVSPIGFRIGGNRTWSSRWFQQKTGYARWLQEDLDIRRLICLKHRSAGIAAVDIERAASKCKVAIHAARPGLLIGKKGAGIEQLKRELQQKAAGEVFVNVHEVRKPESEAGLVAQNVAQQLERRISFRRAMKKALLTAQKFGVQGVRIECCGRLGGAEMSRREWYREGRVPLQTLRARIDYGFAEAKTTAGQIGCKVWLFKGEVLPEENPVSS